MEPSPGMQSSSSSTSCGWFGSIHSFLSLSKQNLLTSLKDHHQICMNCPADESQRLAWDHTFDMLQPELKKFLKARPDAGNFSLIFEYELPRERGRRPDIIILGSSQIFVFEFKDFSKIIQAHVDQVAAYARDLKNYHSGSQSCDVVPVLVLARAKDLIRRFDTITIVSVNTIGTFLEDQISQHDKSGIDPHQWIHSDYAPLPSLIQAARTLWDDKQQLPKIRRALSAGIPQTISELIAIARTAKQNDELHLALVTGVPGSGKTLVGIQLVYENHLDASEIKNNAVFLSGNGPLVKVLQHALKNKFFVQDVHGFLKEYGGSKTKIPHEHIWIYDEAQRAWDAERVNEKRGHPTSEPEDFLRLAERKNSWALMVALIGEGQEIHLGEESGLAQWNTALSVMGKSWIVHCPDKIADQFPAISKIEKSNVLDLTVTLRSHVAEDVTQWVKSLLDGDFFTARTLAERMYSQGFDIYITNDINVAAQYVKERYKGDEEARFGLMASSKAKNLAIYGINTEWNCTRNIRVGPWYNDPSDSFTSCCSLREVVTEFSCQGLELDFPIVCWGNDFTWVDNNWKSPKKSRLNKAKDPHQLRMNSYRVLLTRGRDGFIIFVPNEIAMQSTYEALKLAGIRDLIGIEVIGAIKEDRAGVLC
jgi:DUF2075 family protein